MLGTSRRVEGVVKDTVSRTVTIYHPVISSPGALKIKENLLNTKVLVDVPADSKNLTVDLKKIKKIIKNLKRAAIKNNLSAAENFIGFHIKILSTQLI